jgi:hypothetical protein
MKRILGLLLTLPLCLLAGNKHNWKTGKVLDSQAAKTYLQSGASTTSSSSGTAYSNGAITSSGPGTTATYSGVTTATSSGAAEMQIHNMAIQSTQLLIVGDEYAYVVEDNLEKAVGPALRGSLTRAIANRKHGCRYIVGDAIEYAQDKGNLYVRDTDGKECKLDIIRQERLQNSQPGPQ